jgi:very-short-patch-repair endonuclease
VIDVAAELTKRPVERLVDRAVARKLTRPVFLERRARELRAPGRPGAARVLRALATAHPDLERARNEWEGAVLRFARAAGLPDPEPNWRVVVDGQPRFLDVAWPEPHVCVEFDGYLPHIESRDVFDDDRLRQNALIDEEWKVFRLTSTMVERRAARHFAPVVRAVLGKESHVSGVSA